MILEPPANTGDGLKPSSTVNIHRSWTDQFGTLIATLEGRSGGQSMMVVTKLEDAENTLRILTKISNFKGQILLAVPEQLHAAPLETVLKANDPKLVIALENTCTGIAIRGTGIRLGAGQFTSSTGATYLETGQYQAWESKSLGQLQTNLEQPSIVASVASNLNIPCAVCDFEHLPSLLERLLV
jgi:hypothetical protein